MERLLIPGIIAALVLAGGAAIGVPQYNVWSAGMRGQAELARADQNRQIKVSEAKASLESAKLYAQAEVERAKGTNEANHIMAQSLGGPDNYLRWSFIHMLETTAGKGDRQIIYLPADGLPLLEAGKRGNAKPAQ